MWITNTYLEIMYVYMSFCFVCGCVRKVVKSAVLCFSRHLVINRRKTWKRKKTHHTGVRRK